MRRLIGLLAAALVASTAGAQALTESQQRAVYAWQDGQQARLSTGIVVTCTCTGYAYGGAGALSGTYALGPQFVSYVTGLQTRAALVLQGVSGVVLLPGGENGGATVPIQDTSGVFHHFDATHIIELGSAIANYQLEMSLQAVLGNNYSCCTWPSSNAFTIP